MKNILKVFACFLMLFCLNACDKDSESAINTPSISNNQIYFFYQNTCPHCHHAAQYIKQNHPGLKIVNVDVRTQNGYNLFLKCAQKFHLPKETLGTPLICIGTHYIMGWSDKDAKQFDSYVTHFN